MNILGTFLNRGSTSLINSLNHGFSTIVTGIPPHPQRFLRIDVKITSWFLKLSLILSWLKLVNWLRLRVCQWSSRSCLCIVLRWYPLDVSVSLRFRSTQTNFAFSLTTFVRCRLVFLPEIPKIQQNLFAFLPFLYINHISHVDVNTQKYTEIIEILNDYSLVATYS
jgi:hypothetical protein